MASDDRPGRLPEKPAGDRGSAQGVHIRDIDGHETVDAAGGLWNLNRGHSAQGVKDTISAELDRLP